MMISIILTILQYKPAYYWHSINQLIMNYIMIGTN